MRRALGQSRGQAVVEMALGTLVFVTVFVFAIHFSEVGLFSLKVQEAAVSALWDSTQGGQGGGFHSLPGSSNPGPPVSVANASAQSRYQDFDGRESTNNSTVEHNVFTLATGLSMGCTPGTGPNDGSFVTFALTGLVYQPNHGMSCSSEAEISAYNMPLNFLETSVGGDFHVKNYAAASTTFKVCGVGRAVGGSCQGSFKMLVDDWGLEGPAESRNCVMVPNPWAAAPCAPNTSYYESVFLQYNLSTLLIVTPFEGASSEFALEVTQGPIPLLLAFPFPSEDALWVAFDGEDAPAGPFQQPVMGLPFENSPLYNNTPGVTALYGWAPPEYPSSRGNRSQCFLGQGCN